MTPLDQTLVDQMQSALSKSAPDVAKNIKKPSAVMALGGGLEAWTHAGKVVIRSHKYSTITLSPEQVRKFERFLVAVGWRCS